MKHKFAKNMFRRINICVGALDWIAIIVLE
jgi:hypothetical protein